MSGPETRRSEEIIGSRRPATHFFVTPNNSEQGLVKTQIGQLKDKEEKQEERQEKRISNFINKVKNLQKSGLGDSGFDDLLQELTKSQYLELLISKDFHDYVKGLSDKEKGVVIKVILNNKNLNRFGKIDLFQTRNKFVNSIFPTITDRKYFIKQSIISVKSSEEVTRKEKRKELSNCFLVSELIDTFQPEYKREYPDPIKNKQVRSMFFKRAGGQGEYDATKVEHNEKIRDRFLDVMMNISLVESAFENVLDDTRQSYLQSFFIKRSISEEERFSLDIAIKSIDKGSKDKINGLNESHFFMLMQKLLDGAQKTKDDLKNGFSLADNPANIMSAVLKISDLDKELDSILTQKGISTEVSTKEIAEKALYTTFRNLNLDPKEQEIAESSMRIVTNKDGIETYVTVIRGQEVEVLDASDTFQVETIQRAILIEKGRSLGDTELNQRLDEIELEYFATYNSLDQQGYLRQVRGDEYYKKVESEYRIISSTEMLDKKVDITTKAMTTDKESWNGFKDKIKENSALGENWIKEIKGLENDSLKEEEKNIVLESTNNQLKQTFVNRMLFFLQDSLDINIDSKNTENILSQFSLDKNQKFDNQNILFKGNFNGQSIELKYDMNTGNLSYKPFLSKQQDSIGIFATDFVPFSKELIGPSIQEITSVCDQKINCKEILDKSENDMEKYSQIFGNELETKYPPKLVENKDSIKEDYLKTIIAQEMVDLTQETVLSMHIDSNNGKERYEFYKMIYTNVYQIEENNSINKLQELRENIKDMKNQYDKIKTSTIKEDFSFGPKPILKKLFDKTLVNKNQNVINKDNKTAMWNRFFEDVSDKKNGKDVINSQKIKLFMKGVSNDQDKNKIVESVSESMKPFFDKELDAELIRQYNIA